MKQKNVITLIFFFKGFFLSKGFSHLYPSKTIVKLNIVIILGLGLNCFFINGSLVDRKRNQHLVAGTLLPAALQPFGVTQSAMLYQYLIISSVGLLMLSGL